MASAEVRDELLCSICQNIYTDPVTLRCGHNFCRVCIDRVLDTQDGSGVYSCPDCREEFQERPALRRNVALRNEAECFVFTPPHDTEDSSICCTYCFHSHVPAVKTCLLCEASLCENHLRVHSKGAEHVLTEPSTCLDNRKCPVHKELLKYYCTEEDVCICMSCSLAGKHRGHRVEMLDEASEKKKKKLRNILQKLITKKEKTEQRVQSLEECWRKAQEKASGEAERVTALFTDIRRRVDTLEKKVLSEISRQEKEVSLSSSALMEQLEIKKDELSRKMRHIEELCNRTDPLTVLQGPDTGDLCAFEEEEGDEDTEGNNRGDEDTKGHDGGVEDTKGHDAGDEDTGRYDKTNGVDVITGMLHAGVSDIMTYLQNISPLTPNKKRPRSPSPVVQTLPSHTQDLPASGTEYGNDVVIVDTVGVGVRVKATQSGEIYGQGSAKFILKSDDLKVSKGTKKRLRSPSPSIQTLPSPTQHLPASGTEYENDVVLVDSLGDREKVTAAQSGEIYGQGPADIVLDANTAGNYILLSDDLKTVTWTETIQNRPATAESFQNYQVISSERFSSGRHYWDVKIMKLGLWMVGMCYPSIDRKGSQSYIGYNDKSWSLCRGRVDNYQYSVIHESKKIHLPVDISSDRFRICLDYEAGKLSFYELCDPIRHLHTFTTTFTEPLHAALYVMRGYIKILGSGRWE